MWPFKRRVEIVDFCQEFYNSEVFRPDVGAGALVWDTLLKAIVDADGSYGSIEQADFVRELNAMRVEIFGLAWVHQLGKKELIVPELVFTQRYLRSMNRNDIWEAMGRLQPGRPRVCRAGRTQGTGPKRGARRMGGGRHRPLGWRARGQPEVTSIGV